MTLRRAVLPSLVVVATALLACGGRVPSAAPADGGAPAADGGRGDDDGAAPRDASALEDGSHVSGDTGASSDGAVADHAAPAGDGGVPLPVECSNPGPYASPGSVTSQIVGTWIYCDRSIFVGCTVPIDDVGIEIRSDGTWQKLGFANGALHPLTRNVDIGTWSVTSTSGPSLRFSWSGTGGAVGVTPQVSRDGRTMLTSTSAGGNTSNLAKATGTP